MQFCKNMETQEQQEMMQKFMMFEQQIKQLQEQMKAVNNVVVELQSLHLSLDDLREGSGKAILASVGRGIYAKAKLESEDLLVDVGGGNFVKKNLDESKELIQGQIDKLEEIKGDLDTSMQQINEELTKVFLEAQKKKED